MATGIRQRWDERLDRMLNPILQREIRGTFRGVRFLLMLTGLLLFLAVCLLVVLSAYTSRRELVPPARIGGMVHTIFLAVLGFAVLFVLPAFSAASLVSEEEKQTRDLLRTTTLGEGSIVWGKFLAAMAYTVVFLSAALPLGATSFLFGGVTVAHLLTSYTFLLLLASAVNLFALFISSQMRRSWTAMSASMFFSAAFVIVSLVLLSGGAFEAVRVELHHLLGLPADLLSLGGGDERLSGASFALVLVLVPAYVYLAVTSFSFLSAVNRLKPWSGNRSTNLKLFYAVFLPVGAVLALAILADRFDALGLPAYRRPEILAVVYGAVGLFMLLSAFFPTEDPVPDLAPRLRDWGGRRFRLLSFLGPGARRGFVFGLLANALVLAAVFPFANRVLLPMASLPAYASAFSGPVAVVLLPTSLVLFASLLLFASLALLTSVLLRNDRVRKAVVSLVMVAVFFAPLVSFGVSHGFRRIEAASVLDGGFLSPIVTLSSLSASYWDDRAFVASLRRADEPESVEAPDAVFPYRMTAGASSLPVYAGFLAFAFLAAGAALAAYVLILRKKRKRSSP